MCSLLLCCTALEQMAWLFFIPFPPPPQDLQVRSKTRLEFSVSIRNRKSKRLSGCSYTAAWEAGALGSPASVSALLLLWFLALPPGLDCLLLVVLEEWVAGVGGCWRQQLCHSILGSLVPPTPRFLDLRGVQRCW